MISLSDIANQIETDFPGIWARIEKTQPPGRIPPFPVVTESASRTYPPGTRHPTGFPLSYLLAAEADPENQAAYRQAIFSGVDPNSVFVAYSAAAIQGIAAWRTTRLRFEFDHDLYDALAATPLTGTPPTQIFQHLPARAFFLARRGGVAMDAHGTVGHGFLVSVFDDRLMMMPLTGNSISAGKLVIRFGQDSVEAAMAGICRDSLESSIRVIRAHPNGTDDEKERAVNQFVRGFPRHEKQLRDTWCGALSALMYLCTEEPDVDGRTPPSLQATRMGSRIRFPSPAHETQVNVGVRLGAVFRKQPGPASNGAAGRGSGVPLPPHIRRAHWHTYWVGKRGEQKPELKWLSPILVNAGSKEQLVETVHSVRGEA